MSKKLLIAIAIASCVLLTSPGVRAQTNVDPIFIGPAEVDVAWSARYNGSLFGSDRAASMALHPDGTIVYVTGGSYGSLYSFDYITLAYDAETGGLLWSSRYDTPWRRNDAATHVKVSPDGAMVYVTGTSIGSGADGGMGTGLGDADWDFVTLAYDARTGVQVWEQRYHAHQRGDGWTNSMAISPDSGTVLINGRSGCRDDPATPEQEPGNATVAYDALTGDELWTTCFETCLGYEDFGTNLAVSPDSNRVILAGTRQRSVTGWDFVTIVFNLQTGEVEWVRHYDNGLHDPDAPLQWPIFIGTDPTFDSARAIAVDPLGLAVYVTGVSRGRYGLVDYATVMYELSSGNLKGIARFDGDLAGNDTANAIAVSPDGLQVFVTGESQTVDVGREVVTIAYDAQLNEEQWVVRHNTSDSEPSLPDGRDDAARLISVSDDGRTVLVGGDSWGENSLDWMFAAYDTATGEQRWSGLYDGEISHADFYRGLAVNSDASMVFFAGHTCGCGTNGIDILTMGIRVDDLAGMEETNPWFPSRGRGRHVGEATRRR